jgi:hypothetical protein
VAQKKPNQITKRQALPDSYPVFLHELKQHIRESQVRASMSVNRELVLLYWRIAVLADRTRHPSSARSQKLGCQGH